MAKATRKAGVGTKARKDTAVQEPALAPADDAGQVQGDTTGGGGASAAAGGGDAAEQAASSGPEAETTEGAAKASRSAAKRQRRKAGAAETGGGAGNAGNEGPTKSAKPCGPGKPTAARKSKSKPAGKEDGKESTSKGGGKATSRKSAAAAGRLNGTQTSAAGEAATAGESAGPSPKPWLKNYPSIVPTEIGPLPAESIAELLVKACKQHSSRPAFTCMGVTLSYGQLERHSAAIGAYLQSKGLMRGARVALMMPNVLQYPVAMLAVLRAGYAVVNVNPLYTPRELEHQLKDSGAEAIIILENFAHTLQAVIAKTRVKHVVVAAMGDMLGVKGVLVNLVVRRLKRLVPAWSLPGHVRFPAALKQGAAMTFRPARVGAEDVAFLQYTGGTTGLSKGATLSHRNIVANVVQNTMWCETAFVKKPRPANLIYVCALPLYHIYALTVNALVGMHQGAHNVLIPNPRDLPAFVKELAKRRFNIFPGLNTLFNALLNNEDFRKLDFKPLLLTFGGGMAVQRTVADRWQSVTGGIISEGYGLSETSPVATVNRFDADAFTGTIGLPLPSTDIAIRDDAGNDMPLGQPGEICIRGPQVMEGYWNRPDETAEVMTRDGFFRSGDIGIMDESGLTKIVDRKKDMILVSGFNVYPNELEEVVSQHPGVLEVAAIGVPDERSGEAPKLFVVRKDPALTAEQLQNFCSENLTNYKRPRQIEFRDSLPKSNIGKILRRELRG